MSSNNPFRTIVSQVQACQDCGLLVRMLKVPPNDKISVPICKGSDEVVKFVSKIHEKLGHCSWNCLWDHVRWVLFCPQLAQICCKIVSYCVRCQCAYIGSSKANHYVSNPVPSTPWKGSSC